MFASARKMDKGIQDQFVNFMNDITGKCKFSLLGEPLINLFLLNLKTDSLK